MATIAADTAGLLRVGGVIVALVVTPTALVWPRLYARLVPPPWRSRIVRHPFVSALLAIPPTVWVAVAMCALTLSGPHEERTLGQLTLAYGLVVVIFGGATFAALLRVIRVGRAQWELNVPAAITSRATAVLPRAAQPSVTRDESVGDFRPLATRHERALRSAARWLVAAGTTWYFFGRALQASRHNVDMPGWWWLISGLVFTAGATVWTVRRLRWRARRAMAAGGTVEPLLRAHGLAVCRPAGEWVRHFAPAAFIGGKAMSGPALWPWAATGEVDGNAVILATQSGQVRNKLGLTSTRTRTVCGVQIAGARLPLVIVTGREHVSPSQLHQSVTLELEQFNRQLWAWGPDLRQVYDVLHPRALAHALRELPDGATLLVSGDAVCVFSDEPVPASELPHCLRFATMFVQLLPSYLLAS